MTEEPRTVRYKCNLCGGSEHRQLFTFQHRGRNFPLVECRSCGLVFQNPRPRPGELDAYYDSEYFGSHEKEFTSWQKFPGDLEDAVIDMPRMGGKRGKFLDIGCGIGVYVAYMKRKGWDAKGLDISGYCVEYGEREMDLDLFCGTLAEAKYPSSYFDAIYMRDVIEHLSEPLQTLEEVARILKPDGWFYLTTGNFGGFVSRLRQHNWFYLQGDHIHYFSLTTMGKMLNRAGLGIVRMGPEYPYGRSISELKKRSAPRLPIRIGEFILNTRVAPFLFRSFGATAAEPLAQTMSLHIQRKK